MILLLGPPGAGKSLQAKLLADAGKVQWLSVGRLLRDHIDSLPESMKEEMVHGKLLDDDVVSKILGAAIETAKREPVILIDGFPRRQSQVKWLKNYLRDSQRAITKIIHLKAPELVAVERLKKRGRLDDDEQTVKTRYSQYEDEVVGVIETFSGEGVPVHEVDGNNSVEAIHNQIMTDIMTA